MARIFGTGFENQDLSIWTLNSGCELVSTSGLSLSGSYCLKVEYLHYIRKILPSDYSELYVAFKYRYYNSGTTTGVLFVFYDNTGTPILCLLRNLVTQLLMVYRGNGSALLKTGVTPLSPNTTYLIQVYYKPLNSGGQVIVKVDLAEDINYSGDTTEGAENVRMLHFGCGSVPGTDSYYYMDDIIIDDANWIGNTAFQGLTVTGAGTTTEWTASTGDNHECVDEVPYNDADYVSTNTVDHIDTFAASNLSGTINSINGIYLQARCKYEGNPTPTHIQLGVRSGGTDYFATDKSPPSSFGSLMKILETDPATSAAWSESGVNAAEIGYKATA